MLCVRICCVVASVGSMRKVRIMIMVPFSPVAPLVNQLEFMSSAFHGALQLVSNESKRVHGYGVAIVLRDACS